MTPDDVLAELQHIRTEQDSLEPASPAYAALERRRHELQTLAQTAADAARGQKALEVELEHLEARLQQLEGEKVDIPDWQVAMHKYAINDPAAPTNRINATIDEKNKNDRTSIEARILQIKQALAE